MSEVFDALAIDIFAVCIEIADDLARRGSIDIAVVDVGVILTR
jgi:hypothetical protein